MYKYKWFIPLLYDIYIYCECSIVILLYYILYSIMCILYKKN